MRFSPRWSWRLILGLFCIVAAASLVGCPPVTPQQQADLTAQTQAASTRASAVLSDLNTQLTALVASTQTSPPPTTQAIADEQKKEKALRQAITTVQTAKTGVDAVGPILIAISSGQDPGAAITGAAPATGPAAPYVALAGILVSLGFGVYQTVKKNQAVADAQKTTTAANTAIDAVQGVLASGQVAVTNPNAAAAVDAALTVDHPLSNRLVDVIAAATPAPPAPGGKQ